jgi:hypothetical protein
METWCPCCNPDSGPFDTPIPPEVILLRLKAMLNKVLDSPGHPQFERSCGVIRDQIEHVTEAHLKPLHAARA